MNQFPCSITLLICSLYETWELIITQIFSRRKLGHIEQRLLFADVWVEHHKFRICILSLHDSSKEDLVGIYHSIDHGSKCPFVFLTFSWQDNVNTRHKVMSWHARLICKPKKLKLFFLALFTFELDILVFEVFILSIWSLAALSALFLLFLRILAKFENMLILLAYRNKLLSIVISLSLLRFWDLFTIRIVNLGQCPLNCNFTRLSFVTFCDVFAVLFQGW